MVQPLGDGEWRSIAEQASKELEPTKLTTLVEKLCCALDHEHQRKSRPPATPKENPGSFLND